jgi:hypothetical protein
MHHIQPRALTKQQHESVLRQCIKPAGSTGSSKVDVRISNKVSKHCSHTARMPAVCAIVADAKLPLPSQRCALAGCTIYVVSQLKCRQQMRVYLSPGESNCA